MTDIILIFDAEGQCRNIASTNTHLLDRSAMEFIGKAVHDLFLADHADRLLQHIDQALARRKSVSWTYRLCINHTDVWFAASIVALDATSVIFIARDLTEQKRAEAALRQLAAIVESSDDAIISKNPDGVIVSWNAGAERL